MLEQLFRSNAFKYEIIKKKTKKKLFTFNLQHSFVRSFLFFFFIKFDSFISIPYRTTHKICTTFAKASMPDTYVNKKESYRRAVTTRKRNFFFIHTKKISKEKHIWRANKKKKKKKKRVNGGHCITKHHSIRVKNENDSHMNIRSTYKQSYCTDFKHRQVKAIETICLHT